MAWHAAACTRVVWPSDLPHNLLLCLFLALPACLCGIALIHRLGDDGLEFWAGQRLVTIGPGGGQSADETHIGGHA